MEQLHLQRSLTSDTDINGALLATSMDAILTHCTCLVKLNLSQNELGSPGGYALGALLSRQSIVAPNPSQGGDRDLFLFNSLRKKSWVVNVSESNLGDEGLCAFVDGVETTCHVQNLQLKTNSISVLGLSQLVSALSCERIVIQKEPFMFLLDDDINVDDNPLGLESVVAIGKMLSSGHIGHSINMRLSRCQLTRFKGNTNSNGGKCLTAEEVKLQICLLPQSNAVTCLVLDYNNFSREGIHVLAGFLYLCPNLESLGCQNCAITSEDLTILLDQLVELKSFSPNLCGKLRSWNLGDNEIDDSGATALLESLPSLFPYLGYGIHGRLCLINNLIGREMIRMIDEVLEKHKKVSSLVYCLPLSA